MLNTFQDCVPIFAQLNRCPLVLNAGCHNLCSNSHIRSDAFLLTKTARNTQELYSYEKS